MDREAHIAFTRALFPELKRKTIDNVTSIIDNPRNPYGNFAMNLLTSDVKNDPFGLTGFGHRKYNHDIGTAAIMGYMVAGEEGMQAAIAHLFEDHISNVFHDVLGTDGRDLMVSLMKYNLNYDKRHGRKQRKMAKGYHF